MSQKKDLRVVRTQEAIIEAGVKTLLENRSAGMSEIAKAAGIGRATLYRHFKSREELVKQLALNTFEEIDLAFSPYEGLAGREGIEKVLEIAMPMANQFNFLTRLWSFVEMDKDVQHLQKQSRKDLQYLFGQAKRAKEIDNNLPDVWLSVFFDNVLTTGWELVDSGEASAEEAAAFAKRCFFNGCKTTQ